MDIKNRLLAIGEYAAAGLYEETGRSLFYRKALAYRRFYENCELAEYGGTPLYPSGKIAQRMRIVPSYLSGFNFRALGDSEESLEIRREFCRYAPTVPIEHSVAGRVYTHSMPNCERILAEGFNSYIPRIERITDPDMREGLLHLLEGIRAYTLRCVDYLKDVGAEGRLVDALSQVPFEPARDIYEAIVGWNFITYLDSCDNLGALGEGLSHYYHGEDIIPLLENLYDNLDKNDGYTMSLDGSLGTLAVQCIAAAKGRRRPMIQLFVDENTPSEVWDAAFESLKSGSTQPAFYSRRLIDGLLARFPSLTPDDAAHFSGGGCAEAMIAGMSNVGSLDAGINLLLILEQTMKELPNADSFEDFYTLYIQGVRSTVELVKREINNSREKRAELVPLPMRTLLVDDCIDRGLDYNAGGARYGWSIINFAGTVNVIDSLLAVKELVFDKKRYTAEAFLARLAEENDCFIRELLSLPHAHGRDDPEANELAHRLSAEIFSMTETGDLLYGEGFLSASIQFMSQADAGKNIGPTPDGRRGGAPLCDSLAAIFGKDTRGPTALLNSVTSLALDRALGIPILNFNISRDFSDELLRSLVLGYISKGGIQMQITAESREELLDAIAHPELHRNLVVRVGGFSEYFTRLSPAMQRMIVERSMHL